MLSHGNGREAGQEPMMVNATVHGMVCVWTESVNVVLRTARCSRWI